MDEIKKRFTAFLEQASTREHIKKIARSLSGQFQEHETEDIAQIVYESLIEKKDVWAKIIATPSPWPLIKKIVINNLRDRLLSSKSESPALYFRKRIVDCLRKAEIVHTFEHRSGKRSVICYAFRNSGISTPFHLAGDMIRNIPFYGGIHANTGIKSINTEKRIVELAVYFLDFLEKDEGRQLSIQIDSLWMWIISNLNISDIFADHQHSFEGLIIQPDKNDDVEVSGNNPEQIGYSASCDHVIESDIHLILEKVLESLDEKEKQCLSLFFDNRKLEEIACEIGHKSASGAKYVFDKSIAKIKKIFEDSGYDHNLKDSSTFEKDGAFFVYLKEALKTSD